MQILRKSPTLSRLRHLPAGLRAKATQRVGGLAVRVAPYYKSAFLRRTDFIGITGSCAKTTTKDLVGAVLASRHKGKTSRDSRNLPSGIARTILRVAPTDEFCAVELSGTMADSGATFKDMLDLVAPKIGIVTNVGTDHIAEFKTPENIAKVKGQLVEALPEDGVAILNADDDRVLAMRSRCRCRVVTCGSSQDADVRATEVRSEWPEPLSLRVHHGENSATVTTQLHGEFWAQPVAAAIATGLEMGVPLEAAAAAVGSVQAFARRMEPVDRDDGVSFICDCAKTPIGAVPITFDFMKKAKAKRKIIVVGSLADFPSSSSNTPYISVAKQGLEAADIVVFAGRWAAKVLTVKKNAPPGAMEIFPSVSSARAFLRNTLRPGDLVLLKGGKKDLLPTLIETTRKRDETAAQSAPPKSRSIADKLLGGRSGSASGGEQQRSGAITLPFRREAAGLQVIVGLGNPGANLKDTPHNVGHRALDELATALGLSWTSADRAMVACGAQGDVDLCLIKPMTPLNVCGTVVAELSQGIGFAASECIVVYDDADTPLGNVRLRLHGGDGGHRGIRSVILEMGTFEIRRLKIGVGRPESGNNLSEHVLTSFDEESRAKADAACSSAAKRLNDMIGK